MISLTLTVIFVLANKRCVLSPTIERCSRVRAVEVDRVCTVTMVDESDHRFTTTLHHERWARSTTYRNESAGTISSIKRFSSIFEGGESASLPTEMLRRLLQYFGGKHVRFSDRECRRHHINYSMIHKTEQSLLSRYCETVTYRHIQSTEFWPDWDISAARMA